eukprot:7291932-Karenia_brevis.AAC.1
MSVNPHVVDLTRLSLYYPRHIDKVYGLLNQSSLIPNYHARIKMLFCANKFLNQHGFCAPKNCPILASCSEMVPQVRSWAKCSLRALLPDAPQQYAYFVARLSVICGKQDVWKTKLMNIQKWLRKNCTYDFVQNIPNVVANTAHAACDLLRLPVNMNIRADIDHAASVCQTIDACCHWSSAA